MADTIYNTTQADSVAIMRYKVELHQPRAGLFTSTRQKRDTAMFRVILLAFCRVQREAPPQGKISEQISTSML